MNNQTNQPEKWNDINSTEKPPASQPCLLLIRFEDAFTIVTGHITNNIWCTFDLFTQKFKVVPSELITHWANIELPENSIPRMPTEKSS